jgi:hypothetical protein
MPVYRISTLEHPNRHERIVAPNRKAAHERGCVMWPGVAVEVLSEEEYRLRKVMRSGVREIRAWADAAYCELDEVTDVRKLLGALDGIEATLVLLRDQIGDITSARTKGTE